MTNLKTILASAILFIVPVAAHADCNAQNRTPDGKICFHGSDNSLWIITEGGNGADVSKLYMSRDAGTACPGHRVILEATTKAPALTKEQKFRGDTAWHIKCDRRAVVETPVASPPVASAAPAPTPSAAPAVVAPPPARAEAAPPPGYSRRYPDAVEATYKNPLGEKI